MDSHSLNVKFPQETTQEVARAIEEGRGKLKKLGGPLLLAIGAKLVALIPLFLGGLIFLALKALVVSKIAFVIAAILGLSKLGGGGLGGGLGSGLGGGLLGKVSNGLGWPSNNQATPGWSSGSAGASYPYARNYETGQDLAYNAYNGEVSATQQ